jgi:hypothetical protein
LRMTGYLLFEHSHVDRLTSELQSRQIVDSLKNTPEGLKRSKEFHSLGTTPPTHP